MKKKNLSKCLFMISSFIFACLVMNLNFERVSAKTCLSTLKYVCTCHGSTLGVTSTYTPTGYYSNQTGCDQLCVSLDYDSGTIGTEPKCDYGSPSNGYCTYSASSCPVGYVDQNSCEAGKYMSGITCVTCPLGYTSNAGAVGDTQCYKTCSANTYMQFATASECTACPDGTSSSSHTVYYRNTSTCSSGTETNPKAIITCSNKTYNGSTQTIATYSGGTISDPEGLGAGKARAVGNYTFQCTGDSTHSNADSKVCSIIYDSSEPITTTVHCNAGYYIPINGANCNEPCPDGAYCPAGDYTPSSTQTVGITYCARINGNYTHSSSPRSSRTDCYTTCAANQYVATANGACEACPSGKISSEHTVALGSTSSCRSAGGSAGGGDTSYTITADANGGTIKTPITTGWTMISNSDNKKATKDVSSGSTYGTLPEVTKTDDTLKEWNTKADGTGIKVTSSTTAGETRTIYAIWNSVVTTITGITISPKPAEVEVGKTIQLTAVVTPSTANQTVNWRSSDPNIASVDNNGVVTGKVVGTVTITATTQDGTKSDTAQVTVKAEGSGTTTHNITFNCNGGSGSVAPVSVNFGQTITLPTNSCARIGYTFTGWNTSSNGSGTAYADGASIDYTLNDNLELFAQWTRNSNTYVIHYDANDANGGTGTMTDTVATVDVEGTLKANTFKYSGHTFDGWKAYYKDSNGNWTPLKKDNKEVELKNKAKFTNLMGPNEEEVTLFAQWKVVNPKTGIVTPTAIIGGLLLISAFGYYLVKKKNIVLE